MTARIPEKARYEVKFVSREQSLQDVLSWIRLHPAAFTSRYPSRFVHNVYFDTHDHKAYCENLAGISARFKVRYRWYGSEKSPMAGTLEIKKRRNCYGWKVGFAVADAPYASNDTWAVIRDRIRCQIDAAGRAWLDANPMPALLNEYHRRYFVSADGTIRVTVDTGLHAWDQRFKPRPNFTPNGVQRPVVVVEFKFDRQYRDAASRALLGFPIRVSRNSKYGSGMQALIS